MRTLSVIHDPIFKNPTYNALDKYFLGLIRDERDLPFIYFIIKLTLIFIPMAIAAFVIDNTQWYWWLLFAVYALGLVYYAGPFILMMHNASHRPLFKPEYKLLNRFIPWGLAPFLGQSPDTYFSHHLGMHHAENNLEEDHSSTMPYDRDSIVDFGKYFGSFLIIGCTEMIFYLKRKNRKKLMNRAIIGEAFFITLCVVTAFINLKASLLVFILPMIIVRFSMMAGNWAQHAFISQDSPENFYQNSITCINSVYNRRCYNDGYHIGHHINPSMHWTDMPGDFQENLDSYIENDAIVFEKIDYFVIWFFLMVKKYDWLAHYFVDIGNKFKSKDEVMAFLKSRTKKVAFQ